MKRRGCGRRGRIRRRLLAKDGVCWYCGATLCERGGPLAWPTLDHVIPTAAGGTDDVDNLVLSCTRCNRRKMDRPLHSIVVHVRRGSGIVLAGDERRSLAR